MPEESALIEIANVTLSRDGTRILTDLSWRVAAGERWVILGANGSGKTSLLKVLTGAIWPGEGTVRVFGETYGKGANLPALRRRIGWVSGALAQRLPPWLQGLDAVSLGPSAGMDTFGPIDDADLEVGRWALELVGCSYLAERRWEVMSQGERQRVLVARALAAKPEILILDEPCAGMDPAVREDFLDFIDDLQSRPGAPTLILVTHHLEEIRSLWTHLFVMEKGTRAASGPLREVLTEETTTRAFGRPCRPVWNANGRFSLEFTTPRGSGFRP